MRSRTFLASLVFSLLIAALCFSALPAQAASPRDIKPQEGNQVPTATPQPDGSIIHEVIAGESFYTIAVNYGLTVDALLSLNGLTLESLLNPGDLLLVREAFTPTPSPEPSLTPTPVIPTSTRRPTRTPTLPPLPTHTPLPSATPTSQPLLQLPNTVMFMGRVLPALAAVIGTTGILLVVVGALLKRRR